MLRIHLLTGLLIITFSSAMASEYSSDTTGTYTSSAGTYGTILLVVGILAVLCNCIVVFVILITDNPNVSSLTVIAHMAFWDLIFAMIFLVSTTPSAFLNRFAYSESLISWLVFLWSFVTGVAIFNTVTILADRFISLKWPIFHRKHATKRKYALVGICVYMLSFIRTLLIFLPAEGFIYDHTNSLCKPIFNTTLGTISSSGAVVVSFVLMVIFSCYIITATCRRRRRRVRSELVVPMSGNVTMRSLICVFSAGVFCLSYIPISLRIIFNVDFENALIDDIFTKFATVAYLSNGIWNVFIYSLNYKPFREAFLKLLCKSYYRKIRRNNQLQKAGTTEVFRVHVPNARVVLASPSPVIPHDAVPKAITESSASLSSCITIYSSPQSTNGRGRSDIRK